VSCLLAVITPAGIARAACTAPATDYGSVSSTVNTPSAGTYHIWSRIKAPDTTNNTYLLEIDGGSCYNVGSGTAIPANTWTWVDYQTGSKINAVLAAGSHTIKMIGNKPNLLLDRIILTTDTTCVPTGTGENCANPPDITPPTVSLTAPTAGTTVSGTVQLSANATDDSGGSGVSKVEFYVDGALKGTDSTAPTPFTLSLNTDTLSNGTHTLTAKAYDIAGNAAMSSNVAIIVQNADTTPPTVSLNGVTNNETLQGVRAIGAAATDNKGISKVEFYIDNGLVQTDTSSPYCLAGDGGGTSCFNWDSAAVTNGIHTIKAVAYDTSNNQASASVSITVSNGDLVAPTVTVTAPPNGTTVSGTVPITTTTSDNIGVTKIEYYIDGTLKGSGTTFSWDSTAVLNGAHSITVKAYDAAGNIGSDTVSVTVGNADITPPSVPTNARATAVSATQINLSWTASTDNVGVTGYCITRTSVNASTLNICPSGPVTAYSDTTVQPSTTYTYQITAQDAAGNFSAASGSAMATTPSLADTAAPSTPTNLTGTAASSSQINLSWTASTDNVGVTGYIIYRDTVKIATVTGTSYGDTGLTAGTSYSYYVVARDAASNISGRSNTVTVTTQTAPVAGALSGMVGDRNGPLAGASISTGIGKHNTLSVSTNSSGNYFMPNLQPGNFKVKYSAKRYKSQSVTVTITGGNTTIKNITLSR
jgi:chitodextrinase